MTDCSSIHSLSDPKQVVNKMVQLARDERKRLVDEQEAFEQFKSELEEIPASQSVSSRPALLDDQRSAGLTQACKVYRATVMSVPYYQKEYDETLQTNLAEELGKESAAAVTEGDQLYPYIKTALSGAARRASATRAELIKTIDREIQTVNQLRDRLVEIHDKLNGLLDQPLEHAEFNVLRITRNRLTDLRSTCETLVAERQEQLQKHTCAVSIDIEDFGRYLYSTEETAHPIITHLTEVLTVIDRGISHVEDHLTAVS